MSELELKNPLVWIDCEMTGLDIDVDELVEVAVIITDENLNPVDKGISVVIAPSQNAYENMNELVLDMHTSSGLLKDIENGTDIQSAKQVILDYITHHIPEAKKALLAGNSVGMDKLFLSKQMPEVIEYLHYRIIDVSSIKELAKRWFPRVYFQKPVKTGNHRALGDIQDSIRELEYYRATLFPQGEGPSTQECIDIKEKLL